MNCTVGFSSLQHGAQEQHPLLPPHRPNYPTCSDWSTQTTDNGKTSASRLISTNHNQHILQPSFFLVLLNTSLSVRNWGNFQLQCFTATIHIFSVLPSVFRGFSGISCYVCGEANSWGHLTRSFLSSGQVTNTHKRGPSASVKLPDQETTEGWNLWPW